MSDYLIMTAGPTLVADNVMAARSAQAKNPRFDSSFNDDYKRICNKISSYLNTDKNTYIMCGEGILGLEAACASLTEHGDKVLVITNGIFGDGFADFVNIYGGVPTIYEDDRHNSIDLNKLSDYLAKNHDFKYATMVHCDTPSGVLNNVSEICKLLKSYGILTVVDSVAAFPAEPIDMTHVDILLGGSQKAYSAQVGLTIATVSNQAFFAMESRKTPIASFYANLLLFKDYYFPYSMPSNDISSFGVAIDNIGDLTDFQNRHFEIAKLCREKVLDLGLELYLDGGHSNTVTVINIPSGKDENYFIDRLLNEHNIMISGCFGYLKDKVIRIGHMGESAREEYINRTTQALKAVL